MGNSHPQVVKGTKLISNGNVAKYDTTTKLSSKNQTHTSLFSRLILRGGSHTCQIADQLVGCLKQECGVDSATAYESLKHHTSVLDVVKHLLVNLRGEHNRLLPPLAALVVQDHADSVSLCSRQAAITLIVHRVTGDFSAADRMLHDIFASAKHATPNTPTGDPDAVPSEKFECTVCYGAITPHEGTRLINCSHQFCTSCLSTHIESCFRTPGCNLNVRCMEPDCTKLITEREVRRLCPHDAINTAIDAAIEHLVAADHCLRRCQIAGCDRVFYFCPVRMEGSSTACPGCNQDPGKPTVEQLVEEERALQTMMSRLGVRRCARCGSGVQMERGCNKMQCRCGYRFCFVCGSENGQCRHTRSEGIARSDWSRERHGFFNNVTGITEFWSLDDRFSPDSDINANKFKNTGCPRCPRNHCLELNKKGTAKKRCSLCYHKQTNTYYKCVAGCKFYVCAHCYHK